MSAIRLNARRSRNYCRLFNQFSPQARRFPLDAKRAAEPKLTRLGNWHEGLNLSGSPKLQRWEDLDRVREFDELLTGLDRLSRARHLKLKARIDVGPHPAEAQNIELAARKHSPRRRTRLVVMFKFGGVLITDGEDSEQRQPAALVAPPFVNLLRCLEVETLPSCVEYCGIGEA